MFKTDTALSAIVMPTISAPGVKPDAYFGPNTITTQDWANAVQNEIAYCVTQNGGTLVKGSNTQLLGVINSLIASSLGSGIPNVQTDTSPALGGDLDLNSHSIISTAGRNITFNVLPPEFTINGAILDANDVIINSYLHIADYVVLFGSATQSFYATDVATVSLDLSASGLRLGGANARITTILDEDDFVSNSATATITQQSAKAYADNTYDALNITPAKFFTITHLTPVQLLALTYYYFAEAHTPTTTTNLPTANYASYALRLPAGTITNLEVRVGTAITAGQSATFQMYDAGVAAGTLSGTLTTAAVVTTSAGTYYSGSDMYLYLQIYSAAGLTSARIFTYSFTFTPD